MANCLALDRLGQQRVRPLKGSIGGHIRLQLRGWESAQISNLFFVKSACRFAGSDDLRTSEVDVTLALLISLFYLPKTMEASNPPGGVIIRRTQKKITNILLSAITWPQTLRCTRTAK